MSVQETRFLRPDLEPMRGVYRPMTDSLMLAQAFAADQAYERLDVLDLCCGSGFQGICAALRGHRVDAVDSDRCAVVNARRNAMLNAVQLRVLQGDLFRPVRGRRYDAILVNPPYLPTPSGVFRGHIWCDGGPDGRAVIDRICRAAPAYLAPGGSLWMVQSSLADIPETLALLSDMGFQVTTVDDRLEPFGPITEERIVDFRNRRLIMDGETSERLVVLRATREAAPRGGAGWIA